MISDAFYSELQGYIDDVLAGELPASLCVIAAVQRHVNDLAKQSTSQFPYHFDVELAAKTCRFFPAMTRHSIGRFAGMPFELSTFQKFCTSMLFGWVRDDDCTRRFRRDYRSMGRKNGKSTWVAAESLYQGGFDKNPRIGRVEPVAQVVLAATKKDQVKKVIFAEAKRMRENSPGIARKSECVRDEIRFAGNDGEIIMVGSDKPFSGLNPHAVKLDEVHEFREFHREFYDTMLTGSGARDQPLISIITTAGDDSAMLWNEVYSYAKDVALGLVHDDQFFSFIAELDETDDPFDEDCWIKANPNLGVSVTMDYLRSQATEAKTCRIKTNRFTRYHGNRKTTSIESAFDLTEWDACQGGLSDWKEADAVGCAFDLGARDDLAAEAYVARFQVAEKDDMPVYRYEVKVNAYIGETTTRDLTKPPFCDWVHEDLVKKSRHPLADLRESVIENCAVYECSTVAYDPYNGQSLSEDISKEGVTIFRMAQNHAMFNEPIRDFLCALKDGRITHDGNPLLRWCAKNAKLYKDRKDHWMFDKKSSGEKIDPIVAVVMAFRVCCIAPARYSGKLFIN